MLNSSQGEADGVIRLYASVQKHSRTWLWWCLVAEKERLLSHVPCSSFFGSGSMPFLHPSSHRHSRSPIDHPPPRTSRIRGRHTHRHKHAGTQAHPKASLLRGYHSTLP